MSNTVLKKKKRQKTSTRSSKTSNSKLSYSVKTVKKNKDIVFEVWQKNSLGKNGRVSTFDFKKDAKEFAEFHNKNQIWRTNGGIPNFLLD